MPTSSHEGKDWLLPRIIAEMPGSILDIGAGNGMYARLLRDRGLPEGSRLTALEVYEPYVKQFELEEVYDRVIVADARTRRLPSVDVVILGDVVEHLEHDDAQKVWDKARKAAKKAVFASIPLGEFPQGAVNGNEAERHLTTWTNDSVHDLGGVVASWTGVEIGTYAVLPLT
jgi:hypothetical protein